MVFSFRAHTNRIIAAYRYFWPLLLAHHPLCDCFKDDVVIIGSVRICKGCLATYPPFFGGLAVGLILWISGFQYPSEFAQIHFLIIWGILALGFFLAKDVWFLKKIKIAIRTILFAISGIIFAGLLSLYRLDLILIAYLLASALSFIVAYFRWQRLNAICEKCPEFAIRGRCTGLMPFYNLSAEIDSIPIDDTPK
ncbi:MAG: hypothetical protein ACXAB4_09400 [Candidatus Hodarchaeales archaeon]|jgi:hypothetical protein